MDNLLEDIIFCLLRTKLSSYSGAKIKYFLPWPRVHHEIVSLSSHDRGKAAYILPFPTLFIKFSLSCCCCCKRLLFFYHLQNNNTEIGVYIAHE